MYYVYILTNRTDEVMYVGMTNDITRRLNEHRNGSVDGFTRRYHVHKPVYVEAFSSATDAIAREKQIKGWSRAKKNWLVETRNPNWEELSAFA